MLILVSLLEVKDFLTDKECDLIINTAKNSGLHESTTVRANRQRLSKGELTSLFMKKDINSDQVLDKYEVHRRS